MTDLEMRKVLATRIVAYLDPVPTNAIQGLVGQSVGELEVILDKLASTKTQGESEEAALAHAEESRRQSAFDGAWAHCLLNVWLNGKQRLVDCESNRVMLENSLQPHETPSAAIYSTIALSYPTKFSWEMPRPVQTEADRQAEFRKICREHGLSECVANLELFKSGIGTENWAGASQVERAAFKAEAAQARQHFLIHSATPQQLKQEAAYESQQNREQAQREEAERQHQFVAQQQQGLYSPLPTHNANGEAMDGKYFKRLSTLDYALFKVLVRKFGSAQITERLRAPAV